MAWRCGLSPLDSVSTAALSPEELHPTHWLIYAQVTTGEALHPLTVERLAPQLLGNEASAPLPLADYTAYVRGVFEKLESGGWNESSRPSVSPCVKINQCVGCTIILH